VNDLHKFLRATLVALSCSLLLAGIVLAAAVNIDTFNDGAIDLVANSSTNSASTQVDVTSGVLGNERDGLVTWSSGTGGNVNLETDVSDSNVCEFTQDSGIAGTASLTWDGNDNDPSLDATGLSSQDLTDSNTNTGILVEVTHNEGQIDLTVEAYTDGSNWSDYTLRLSGGLTETTDPNHLDLFFPFDNFTTQAGSGADFSNIGAVVLEIDGTIASGADVTIDSLEANAVRDYGDLSSDFSVSTLSASHIPQGMRLGFNCDAETTYSASTDAKGDNNAGFNDEEGVTPVDIWYEDTVDGGTLRVIHQGCEVDASGCYINGWIDWDRSNSFETSEHVIQDANVTSDGYTDYTVDVPANFYDQSYYARFRICGSSGTCNTVTAQNVLNGEIEDYRWYWGPTAITLTDITARSTPTTAILIAAGVVGLGALAVLALARRRRLP
jgi:hypothetical protein